MITAEVLESLYDSHGTPPKTAVSIQVEPTDYDGDEFKIAAYCKCGERIYFGRSDDYDRVVYKGEDVWARIARAHKKHIHEAVAKELNYE